MCAILVLCAGCLDLRDFDGEWTGQRVGEAPAVRVGFAPSATADVTIHRIDSKGLDATLTTTDGVFDGAAIAPIPGAEADVLAGITFDGSPSRVYLAFVATSDGGGPATAVIAIYDDRRVELRVLRGGETPLYGIFLMRQR